MAGSRILSRVYIFFAIVVIVSAFVIDIIVEQRIISDTLPEVRQSIEEKARLILPRLEEALAEGGVERLMRTLRLVEDESQLTVTFFNLDGEVLYDSAGTVQHFDTAQARPEVAELMENGTTFHIRHSPTHGSRTMFLGRTLMRSGLNFGYIRFAHPLLRMESRILALRSSFMIGTLFALLLAILPAVLLAIRFTRPLNEMRESIKQYARGETPDLFSTRKDEIGALVNDLQNHYSTVEERLSELNAKHSTMASILGGMVEGVIAIDEDENVLYINSFAAAILGSDRSQSEGKRLWEISRRPSISDAILAALKRESAATSEARLVDERGDRFVKIYTSAIIDESGHQTGAVVVLQDVTALRKLADFRQDMITNVSHEFKTPLTAIMGSTETLLVNPDVEVETRQNFLQRIMNQAERLRTLATDVLELNRVESSNGKIQHTPQDIRKILRFAFESLKPQAERKNIELIFIEHFEAITVNCEEQSILQVAENLIDNAIKYTQEGGHVEVRADVTRHQAIIEVSDNGPGIEPTERGRIFERFYRTQAARTPKTKGTGLGLSIIQSIVSSYEGEIGVESEPGAGTKFTIKLPLYRA